MQLRPRDLIIFSALQRHGALPSHYLFEFTKDVATDRTGFRKRLTALYRAGMLERPVQLNNPLIKTDFKVYILTKQSEEVLREVGKLNQYAVLTGGGYPHMLMTACITANIELEARRMGFKFISQEEILASSQCPWVTKIAEKPLALTTNISRTFAHGKSTYTDHSNRPTEPDQLFGIDYGGTYRFFALEADRGTEPLTRPNLKENSILRKILAYKSILISGEYRKRFGIPNLFPLFVTTADARVQNMLDLTRTIYPNGSRHLLFAALPGFQVYFRTPPLLPQLFGEYERTEGPFDITKA